jgi:hypothetical protein
MTTRNKPYRPFLLLCTWPRAARWLAVAFLLLAAGCRPMMRSLQTEGTPQYYKPAAPAAATPTPAPAESSNDQAQATPACIDNLTYVSDVTIPDGSEVEPSATLDKRWEVKNSGNCNWDERYRLRLIAGPAMEAIQEQTLYPARSRAQVTLQIIFQAPAEAGSYHSAWQAYNPDGQPFGDPVFIDIVVK